MIQAKPSPVCAFALAALLTATTSLQAQISVGASGVPADPFDVIPPATSWSTFSIAGGAGTPEDNAGLDTMVQAVAASAINAQVNSTTGNPPGTLATARWSSTGFYLQARPTGNAATLLMATLRNDSGGDVASMNVTYEYVQRLAGPAAELIPGLRVYYSLTGAGGSWVPLGNFGNINDVNSPQTITIPLDFTGSGLWPGGGTLYVVFADDNSAPNNDAANGIDNFAVTAVVPGIQTCVAITNQSGNITVPERGAATFSIMATGSPQNVQWYRQESGGGGFTAIAGATQPTYRINSVVYPGDNGAQFYATVINSLCSVTSTVVTLTVQQDLTPPQVIRAVGELALDTVTLTFNEPINPNFDPSGLLVFETGTPPGTYLTYAAVLTNQTNIILTTDPRAAGVNYSVQILDVRDASSGDNLINPNPTIVPLRTTLELIGFDVNNEWKYFVSTNVDLWTTDPDWLTVGYDDTSWSSGPAMLGEDAGGVAAGAPPIRTVIPFSGALPAAERFSEPAFFRRHFTFPASTNGAILRIRHVFEDGGVVFINGQEAYRFNANAGPWTFTSRAPAGATDPTPVSGPFTLPLTNIFPGDNVIAVLVLQNGTSSDCLMAVELTAEVGAFLSGPPVIQAQPQNLTVNEGQAAAFTVVAEGGLPLFYQWFRGATALNGETNSTYAIAAAAPGDAGSYSVVVSNSFGTATSTAAALTVNPDLTSPQFLSAVASTNLTNITLVIADTGTGINPADLANIANYAVQLTAGGGNLTIVSATVANVTNVVLVTSPRTQGQEYTVVLSNIRDRSAAANLVTPTTRAVRANIIVLAPDDFTLWRYESSSNNLDGLGWQLPSFNDAGWPTALAGFTSSNALETATNGFEIRSTNMLSPVSGGPVTTYYRVPFNFPGSIAGASLQIVGVIDDGLVAYVNGVEAGRLRITNASPVSFTNLATGTGPEVTTTNSLGVTNDVHLPLETITLTNLSGLVSGANLLAIELHQNSLTSSDAVLSIQLVAGIQDFDVGPLPPRLTISRNGGTGQMTISWSGGTGCVLQETTQLQNPPGNTVWVTSSAANGVPFTPTGPMKFYRLSGCP